MLGAQSTMEKQVLSARHRHACDCCKCWKMCEFLSLLRCSRTRVERCRLVSVKNLNNYKVDDAYEVRVRDLGSVVNKEYLNEKFLKVDKDGNYFDLKQNTIKNCEPYYDGLFDDNSLVSKAFVDAEISKLPKSYTDLLKLDGSKAMTGALDMGGFGIKKYQAFCGR